MYTVYIVYISAILIRQCNMTAHNATNVRKHTLLELTCFLPQLFPMAFLLMERCFCCEISTPMVAIYSMWFELVTACSFNSLDAVCKGHFVTSGETIFCK